MMGDPELEVAAGRSEVANFYAQRNVLITGATGFLGTLLTERIIRSCPQTNTLFLLVRAKKGKSPGDRFKELFDDVIFDRLKKERPGFARKVVLIEGDMAQIGLGLSSEHRELLRSTHIVIHGAATVRFDEKLRIAANINLRGTQELLSLAKEMENLKAFVHVSTAYSHCVNEVIEEKFYPPPIDSEKLLTLVDILDDASLEHLTSVLLGKWPNTYTFTKSISEDMIRRHGQSLPLCIIRPSMVAATYKEPITGWISNVYGPTGVMVAGRIGLLHSLRCDGDLIADVIPADYVAASIIVASWKIARDQSTDSSSVESSTVPKFKEPPIYNVVVSNQKPVTWAQFNTRNTTYGLEFPCTMMIWYPFYTPIKHHWVNQLLVIFLHLIPAAIVDSLIWLAGRKPVLWNAYRKLHKFSVLIAYFCTQEWKFENDNVQRLYKSLGPADRNKFDLDIGTLDWEEWSHNYARGIRVYVLKDPLNTLPQAHAKYTKLKVAHYTLVAVLCLIILWVFLLVLRFTGLSQPLQVIFHVATV